MEDKDDVFSASLPHNLRVLIVDRDKQSLQNLKEMLQQCGYNKVTCLETAEDALWLLQHSKAIDLLMCEASKPNYDGFQLLSAVSKDFKSVYVTVFSNRDGGGLGSETAVRALALGASAFYGKPISIEVLRHMWQQVCRKKIQSFNESAPNLPPQTSTLPLESCSPEENSVTKRKRRDTEEITSLQIASKKQRLWWTGDLERKFTAAVDVIRCTGMGITGPRILELMKGMGEGEDLTVSQIGSQLLQHYL